MIFFDIQNPMFQCCSFKRQSWLEYCVLILLNLTVSVCVCVGHIIPVHHRTWCCEICHQRRCNSGGARWSQNSHHHVWLVWLEKLFIPSVSFSQFPEKFMCLENSSSIKGGHANVYLWQLFTVPASSLVSHMAVAIFINPLSVWKVEQDCCALSLGSVLRLKQNSVEMSCLGSASCLIFRSGSPRVWEWRWSVAKCTRVL